MVKKYNKKTFFNKNIPQLKKTQQARNLYQGNCSSTTFRSKVIWNSFITPVKGYTPIDAKLILKHENRQFSFSRKASIFCKTLEKTDNQPRNFRMDVWSKNRLHFGTISGKSSTSSKNVSTGILVSDSTKEVESMLKRRAIQKASVKKVPFLCNLFLVGKKDGRNRPVINWKNLNAFIPYLHLKMEGLHLLKDMLEE